MIHMDGQGIFDILFEVISKALTMPRQCYPNSKASVLLEELQTVERQSATGL